MAECGSPSIRTLMDKGHTLRHASTSGAAMPDRLKRALLRMAFSAAMRLNNGFRNKIFRDFYAARN